jgi:hypothetical protein
MSAGTPPEVRRFFADAPLGLAVFEAVRDILSDDVEVRVGTSQVAFRRRRGFAYLWLPGRYLRHPAAEVVLSIALDHEITSPRFKEVVHPAAHVWMHHLEIGAVDELDAEVAGWVREAHDRAG